MSSVNKVFILGNLGNDPEIRYTGTGTAVTKLSVATNEYWTNKEGNRETHTEWHRVVVWGKQGENCAQYLAKGRSVFIEGKIRTNEWTDKEGQKRYTSEIIAQNVQFVGQTLPGGEQKMPSSSKVPPDHSIESPKNLGLEPDLEGSPDSDIPF
jgi:single-strand DNA-binding protein